jgi:hypothetical protein
MKAVKATKRSQAMKAVKQAMKAKKPMKVMKAMKANKVAAPMPMPRPATKTFVKSWSTTFEGPHYVWKLTSVVKNGNWVTENWSGVLKQ